MKIWDTLLKLAAIAVLVNVIQQPTTPVGLQVLASAAIVAIVAVDVFCRVIKARYGR